MRSRVLAVLLLVGLSYNLLAVAPRIANWRLPGDQQDYEPEQPLAYSHRLHAGDLQVPCLYCHFGAERSRHAGIPPASVCMNCHTVVTAPMGAVRAEDEAAAREKRQPRRIVSAELSKLYAAMGLDEHQKPDSSRPSRPIRWVKIHNLPDFAYFDHRPHVKAGVACQPRPGPVEQMERGRQVQPLSMGWCVNCHRDANARGVHGKPVYASIDCVSCHY